MSPAAVMSLCGMLLAIVGLGTELVAMSAMAFHRVRRALPVKSPLDLLSAGGVCFVAGVALVAIGDWLAGA